MIHMGIDSLNYLLYFNLLFFGMLGLGMLFGFLRGLRKSLYHFIVKLLFYVIFFATLGIVTRFFWTVEFTFISSLLNMLDIAGLGDANSFSDALPIILESVLGDTINADLSNANFLAFAEGIGLFILKILYAVIYFTVIQLLYRFSTWVIYMIFFKQSKEHREEHGKKRVAGMAVGLGSGVLAVYASLVILGGIMDVADNTIALLDATDEQVVNSESRFIERNDSLLALSARTVPIQSTPLQTPEDENITAIRNLTEAYKNNLVVRGLTSLKLTDDDTQRETKLNLYFFDRIFSINHEVNDDKTKVALRHELAVFTDVASIFMVSEFSQSRDFTDLEAADIESVFNEIANSDLFVTLVPIALDMGAEHFEVVLNLEEDDLYAIDYKQELTTLGQIASSAFSLINTAGLLVDSPDYDTLTLDGDTTKSIFDNLASSELANLAAYVAMEPLLEQMLGDADAVITLPSDLVWEDEFAAFGNVAKNILDTNITLGDIQSTDPLVYVDRLSSMDLTVLLESRIIEQAMVNVFNGDAGLEGMDMMVAHDSIQWRDTFVGNTRTDGELRIMLDALNTLAEDDALSDIEDFSVNIILNISETTLDALFASEVLSDTLGNFIVEMAEDPFVIPSTTLKTITVDGVEREIVTSTEIKNIFLAVLELEIEDLQTVEFDPTLLKNLAKDLDDTVLDETKTDTLFASEILHATLSDVLLDQAAGPEAVFTIPETDIDSNPIVVQHSTDSIDLVSTDELNAILDAFLALNISDFSNISSINLELIKDDFTRLLNSAIIHATFSDQIIDLTSDDTLNVPYYDETDTVEIRKTVNATEFIIKTELQAVVDALDVLDMLDFQSFDGTVDLTILETQTNRNTILASSILQATISNQLIGLDEDGTITVPYFDETNTTAIRTLTTSSTPTEYVIKDELDAVIRAMDILNILDIDSFSGNVDLSILAQGTNADDVLDSSIIQATVSKQLSNLDTDGTITLPYLKSDDSTSIRLSVGNSGAGTDSEYVSKIEIKSIIDALDILGITDVTAFDGAITLTDFYDQANRDTLLASAVMHATISQQLIDLNNENTLNLPYFDETDTTQIRITTSSTTPTEYVNKNELHAMIEALEVLGINDINNFTGDVDLNVLAQGTNAAKVLESSLIQATVSEQLLDLDTDGLIKVPYVASDDSTLLRLNVGNLGAGTDTEYVLSSEIESIIKALDILDITDVSTFDGTIALTDFYDETNRNTLLASSVMHATMSTQVLDLGANILVVPEEDVNGSTIRLTTTTAVQNTEYVTKDELHAMIESLEILGITKVDDFTGGINLTNIYEDNGDDSNQNALLSSASMHATITQQIDDTLGASILNVPNKAQNNTLIRTLQSFIGTGSLTFKYITKAEIKALINSLEVMNITDITSYSGGFALSNFSTEADQDTLLASASIHKTFSDELTSLNSAVLIVPDFKEDGTTPLKVDNEDSTKFVVKGEIKALINAFDTMGYTDLDSFGASIDSTAFFNSRETLLLSSSIQATVSNKLLNDTGNALLVPDQDINNNPIRLLSDTYIKSTELSALLDGLDLLGLQSFGTMNFTPTNVFNADFNTVMEAVSLQLTISDTILDTAKDNQTAASAGDLIIPTALQEQLAVDSITTNQIKKAELINLLEGLDALGVSSFDGAVNASTVTSLNETTLTTILESGSMHVTVDLMIDSNTAMTIPEYDDANSLSYDAVNDLLHGITDITLKTEIIDFIAAVNVLSSGDVTNASFDLAAIDSLNATQQGTIFTSMIARNTLTPDMVSAYKLATTNPSNDFSSTYYHDDKDQSALETTYLSETGIADALTDLQNAGY